MADAIEQDPGFTITKYFEMARNGYFAVDDRVELLEGLIVASPPPGPLHASVTMDVEAALRSAVGHRASVRGQMPLLLSPRSAPEPDVAVVAGSSKDYRKSHPTRALLVVEISESSLPHDRLTKSRIYASANIPEYWIVNLRDRTLEVMREPDPEKRVFASTEKLGMADAVELIALPGVIISVGDLLSFD